MGNGRIALSLKKAKNCRLNKDWVIRSDHYSHASFSTLLLCNAVKAPDLLSSTVVGQTDFDITLGKCVVLDRNLACAVLVRHKTLSNGGVKVCQLPQQLNSVSHCRTKLTTRGLRLVLAF